MAWRLRIAGPQNVSADSVGWDPMDFIRPRTSKSVSRQDGWFLQGAVCDGWLHQAVHLSQAELNEGSNFGLAMDELRLCPRLFGLGLGCQGGCGEEWW